MKITRSMLKSVALKPFDKTMYMGFSGVESPCPFYSEFEVFGTQYLLIIDGAYAELYSEQDLLDATEPSDICEDIRQLP